VLVAERLGMEKGRAKGQAEGRIEGRVEGRIEGRVEGRVEGRAELLLLQIERRFGPVAKAITQRVRHAQAKDLETWSLNILDATTLDDVFKG
uniref:DUF4351 domain-containing protein n=1 Tax=Castellaniella caeni TaxID=266123 RepID=UPI0011AECD5A